MYRGPMKNGGGWLGFLALVSACHGSSLGDGERTSVALTADPPRFGAERSTGPVHLTAPYPRSLGTSAASADGSFATLWRDAWRNRVLVTVVDGPARITDPAGAQLLGSGTVQDGAIAATSTGYLAVWSDFDAGVLASPLAGDGHPIGTKPAVVGPAASFHVGVACRQPEKICLLATNAQSTLSLRRVSELGVPLDTTITAVTTDAGAKVRVGVVQDGFVVVWSTGTGLFSTRVSTAGTVANAAGVTVAATTSANTFDLAANGADAYAVWYDAGGDALKGKWLSSAGAADALSPAGLDLVNPAVTVKETTVMAFFSSKNDLWFTAPAVGVVAQPTTLVQGIGFSGVQATGGPQAALLGLDTGAGYLVSWSHAVAAGPFSYEARTIEQAYQDLALSATNGLLVWNEASGWDAVLSLGASKIWGARVDLAGALLDVPVTLADAAKTGFSVQAAFDGTSYLAAWSDGGVLRGRSISVGGVISTVASLGNGSAPRLRCLANGHCLLASFLPPGGALTTDVRRVDGLVAAAQSIQLAAPSPLELAASSGSFLLVGTTGGNKIQAVRFDGNGAALDASPITVGLTTGCNTIQAVAVASDGNDFLVGWPCVKYAPASQTLFVARVAVADGTVSAIQPLASAPGPLTLASDGAGYLATWVRADGDLDAARLDTLGALSSTVVPIGRCGGGAVAPVLASGTGGHAILSYTRPVAALSGSARVKLRDLEGPDAGDSSSLCDDTSRAGADGGAGDARMDASEAGTATDASGGDAATTVDGTTDASAGEVGVEAGGDSGVSADAGVDSTPTDVGPDAGTDTASPAEADAMTPADAALDGRADARPSDAGPPQSSGGCGCALEPTGPTTASLPALLMAVAGLVAGRRRRR
jgi:MYXO-CTERM domain-containing protein